VLVDISVAAGLQQREMPDNGFSTSFCAYHNMLRRRELTRAIWRVCEEEVAIRELGE